MNEAADKAYDQIEINPMRACAVEVDGKTLHFCLEPKEAGRRSFRIASGHVCDSLAK